MVRELLPGEVVCDDESSVYEDGKLLWGAPLYVIPPIQEYKKCILWKNAVGKKAPLPSFGEWLRKPEEEYSVLGGINFQRIWEWSETSEGWNEEMLDYSVYTPH